MGQYFVSRLVRTNCEREWDETYCQGSYMPIVNGNRMTLFVWLLSEQEFHGPNAKREN